MYTNNHREPEFKSFTIADLYSMYQATEGEFKDTPIGDVIKNTLGALHLKEGNKVQRGFVYLDNEDIDEDGNKCTKAAHVIKTILEGKLACLPPIILWHEDGTPDNEYKVHDGKQRLTSIFKFMNSGNESEDGHEENTSPINPRLSDNTTACFQTFTEEQRSYFNNYKIYAIVLHGNIEDEENSFVTVNTTGAPLSDFEAIRAGFGGPYMDEFLDIVRGYATGTVGILDPDLHKGEKNSRGAQTLNLLAVALGHWESISNCKKVPKLVRTSLGQNNVRNTHFNNPAFEEFLKIYRQLISYFDGVTGIHINREPMQLAYYIMEQRLDLSAIIEYIVKSKKKDNDMGNWTFSDWKSVLPRICKGDFVDPLRKATQNMKGALIARDGLVCKDCGAVLKSSEVTIDHIIPWSKGGKTELSNLQILCRSCNSKKGNKTE